MNRAVGLTGNTIPTGLWQESPSKGVHNQLVTLREVCATPVLGSVGAKSVPLNSFHNKPAPRWFFQLQTLLDCIPLTETIAVVAIFPMILPFLAFIHHQSSQTLLRKSCPKHFFFLYPKLSINRFPFLLSFWSCMTFIQHLTCQI